MNKMIKVFDNLLDENFQNEIEKILTDNWFPWHFNKSANVDLLVEKNGDQNTKEYPQFTHIFFNNQSPNSDFFDLSYTILNCFFLSQGVEIEKLIRIKSNLVLKDSSYPCDNYSTPHIDADETHSTLIYYVTDSDGPTYVFNETQQATNYSINSKIDPKKGRFLYFDGSYYHSGSPPKEHDFRLLINYNFSIKPKL